MRLLRVGAGAYASAEAVDVQQNLRGLSSGNGGNGGNGGPNQLAGAARRRA
ncbi:hypothetical protein [Mycobacterium attenuatum]|uniref:hypothetical protein n=1 Tax=Mycobacterium attenuatum TaxID=2341086 RepID=UPI001FCE7468|nr:hypothetical protein [Mycobacterium attenuatum]